MAVGQPFPRGTFKVGIGPGEREVSVIFKSTQSTIVFSIIRPVNSLRNIRSITQDLATSVALMNGSCGAPGHVSDRTSASLPVAAGGNLGDARKARCVFFRHSPLNQKQ
jgi:hypothetical protein